MSSDDVAISVRNLSKCYEIFAAPRDRLKQFVIPTLCRAFPPLRNVFPPPHAFGKEFWALKDVSFDVKRGETVGIIGRNGSGKSTLLQLICGTLYPTAGSIEVHGRIAALLELGAGFNTEFTGRENVRMSCALLGLSPEETEARFDDITDFAEIGDFVDQPVKTYSSGMALRLAFAVNIVSRPDIMIVDEALAVGDMNFQAKCMTALTSHQKSGATVLFVSHDIAAIKNLCSRAVFLDHGQVLSVGPAPDVADGYLRVMNEELNRKTHQPYGNTNTSEATSVKSAADLPFITSEAFTSRIARFRYGTGEAKCDYVQMVDEVGNEINHVIFDQVVYIRMYFSSYANTKISPAYYIQDSQKNSLLGASWVGIMGLPIIESRPGDRFIVTYKTRLPLQEGYYTILSELFIPIVPGESNRTLDIFDNAVVFCVAPRTREIVCSKVYCENTVSIQEIKNQTRDNISQREPMEQCLDSLTAI